jgi:predicted amidohydrolase
MCAWCVGGLLSCMCVQPELWSSGAVIIARVVAQVEEEDEPSAVAPLCALAAAQGCIGMNANISLKRAVVVGGPWDPGGAGNAQRQFQSPGMVGVLSATSSNGQSSAIFTAGR